jgi:hypothetical protein
MQGYIRDTGVAARANSIFHRAGPRTMLVVPGFLSQWIL